MIDRAPAPWCPRDPSRAWPYPEIDPEAFNVNSIVVCARCGYAGLPACCGEQPGGPGAWRGCGTHVCPHCWNHEPLALAFRTAQPFWAGDLVFA